MKWSTASLARIAFICGIALITVLSVIPQPAPVPAEGIDKVEHALAYFMVGIAGMIGYRYRFSLLRIAVATMLYGCAMEGVQYFLPGRVAGIADIVANGVGIAAALVVVGTMVNRGRLGAVADRTDD